MTPAAQVESSKRFRDALRDLLVESEYVTQSGNPNLHAFADALPGLHYETLRKVLAGERNVTPRIMEEVAVALRVKPTYFAEYRLHQAQQMFDPRLVGFEEALQNFKRWGETEGAKQKRRGRS